MVKPGALLLLLAAAVSQVDLFPSQTIAGSGEVDMTGCPLDFYGAIYTRLRVTVNGNTSADVCFINNPGEASQDCLLILDAGDGARVSLRNPYEDIVPFLPNQKSSCRVFIYITHSGVSSLVVSLAKFGQQTAMHTETYGTFPADNLVMSAKVGGSTVDSWTWTKTFAHAPIYTDLRGCRHSGSGFAVGAVIQTGENCAKLVCGASAVVQSVAGCGATEVCISNNMCVVPTAVCTVTGSSVIDVFGRVLPVQDQCAYSLMRPHGSSGFNLMAVFSERRRKDVPLLDHLMVQLNGVTIRLGQSGRVTVDGQTLELNATPQLVEGVALSKDQTGVTVALPPSVSDMTFSFDGNTAHVSAGLDEAVTGLCGHTPDPAVTIVQSDEKSSDFSAEGCETRHSDDPDSTIDCTLATERCNLMNQAPFTACHDHADPEPFITACTNTSCRYPAVDGLSCQFLEAYAESCFLNVHITLEEWRSQAGCPAAPQAFCPQYCSDHEFCGESIGERRCLCRATFASKYRATDSLGDPTVCVESSATLTLAGCLLTEKGVNYSTLHLKDPDCKGRMDEETHMVTFSFNSSDACGTEVLNNNSQLMYKNTVMTQNDSAGVITRKAPFHIDFSCYYTEPEDVQSLSFKIKDSQLMYKNTVMTQNDSAGVITRKAPFHIDFSCYYTEPEDVQSLSFKIKDSSVVKEIVSGVWNYTLWMSAYTDSGLMNPVGSDTDILLDQPIWVELKTEGLDANMVAIVTDSCWATSQPPPDSSPRYDLVTDGCPNLADPTVSVAGNGRGTSNAVSFNMFRFSGQTEEVYLHCKLELCPTLGQSCAPPCGAGGAAGGRKRRSFRTKYADGNAALITVAWSI